MTKAEYKKAREELLVMLVCTVLVALLLFYVIPVLIKVPAAARKDVFTPQTFPYFLGIVMAVCVVIGDIKASVAFVKARRQAQADGALAEKAPKKTRHEIIASLIPWLVYGLVVLYGVGINRIGFIIPTVIMIPAVLLLIGCRKWRYYLYVYLFAAAMWAIFKFVLHVQLP
ncbi:MAG: tripartite tricarboxylate transporter TctB family protein [Clostridia bacterium]|nr:tripartite tricarboxylate transporter TctB family protein [Clostridia bacterium]